MNKILQDARALWSLCFPSEEEAFLDFYFGRVACAEDTYLEYDERGQVIGHVGILRAGYFPRRLPKRISVAYISGACVHPDHRGQGVMERLMARVEQEELERHGTQALVLIPAHARLRRYYQEVHGFQEAAPRYTTSVRDLEHLRLELLFMEAETEAQLLEEYGGVFPTVIYSPEHAALILEEYRLNEHYQILSEKRGEVIEGLLLAHDEGTAWVIDWLMGYDDATRRLVRRLNKIKPQPITISNLSSANLSEEMTQSKFLREEAWGMYKSLDKDLDESLMRELLVCHFFE